MERGFEECVRLQVIGATAPDQVDLLCIQLNFVIARRRILWECQTALTRTHLILTPLASPLAPSASSQTTFAKICFWSRWSVSGKQMVLRSR